ncbi:MAG: hypothetical protein H6Q75_1260 [Firmicutes bacterium]|nr:hypothetical protein [Bacillota bacterium]
MAEGSGNTVFACGGGSVRRTGGRLAKKTRAMSSRSGRSPKSVKLFRAAACRASSTSGVMTKTVGGVEVTDGVLAGDVTAELVVGVTGAEVVDGVVGWFGVRGVIGGVGMVAGVGIIALEKTAFCAVLGLVSNGRLLKIKISNMFWRSGRRGKVSPP